ncbi:hypothetical protein HY632_03310 [Candidatus Uhrbacteria bacterium]|nr:hypothetical protein [Candidatus Uhrbacteria bacterium]
MVQPVGHDPLLRAFDRLLLRGRIGHAYLLVGPSGVGKMTVVHWFAHRVLCRSLEELADGARAPCGSCDACRAVTQGTHPDVQRMTGGVDGVDALREWRTALLRTSLFSGWKIGIVESVDALSESAANAMLKILEEPQERTLLLLTARHPRAPLATIASRCAIFRCHRMPMERLERELQTRGYDAAIVARVTQASEGCFGRALQQCAADAAEGEEQQGNAVAKLFQGRTIDRFRWGEHIVNGFPGDRDAAHAILVSMLDDCRRHAREVVRSEVRQEDRLVRLLPWIRVLARGETYLAAHSPPRLFLETLSSLYP